MKPAFLVLGKDRDSFQLETSVINTVSLRSTTCKVLPYQIFFKYVCVGHEDISQSIASSEHMVSHI